MKTSPIKHTLFVPLLIVLVGLVATSCLGYLFFKEIRKKELADFKSETNKMVLVINNRMDQYESAIIQARAFLEVTPVWSEEIFRTYFRKIDLMNRYPGLLGLGYASFLGPGDKRPPGMWPSGKREAYTPIIYLEPKDKKNKRALSFDMYSELHRREAMIQSYQENRAVATRKIYLVQESDKKVSVGFNIYLPVFENKQSKKIRGFLYSPFRSKTLMDALSPLLNSRIHFAIYDRDILTEEHKLYESHTTPKDSALTLKKKLNIASSKYVIVFKSMPEFQGLTNYFPVYATIIAGFLASLLLGLITFLKNRQVALISSREQKTKELKILSDAIENSLSGFDIVSDEGKFIYVNKAYLTMWGYDSAEEVLGTSPADHCADPDVPLKIITDLKTHKKCDLEFKAKRKDGSLFDVRMLAYLTHDIDGREIYPTTSIDISEQRATEQRLLDAVRARDEFLSIASHELKTPLTSLLLLAQLNARSLPPEDTKAQRFADNIVSNTNRLTRLVDDMLDVARIRTGKLTLFKENVDLFDITNDVIKRMETQINQAGISAPEFSKQGDLKGHWDRMRLEQVLINLFTNALKYGNGKPFSIAAIGDEKKVTLTVKDQGIGIPDGAIEKIFNRFERAINSSEASGLGLGLFIVKQIVEAHGGNIEVESITGVGSSFRITLPKKS